MRSKTVEGLRPCSGCCEILPATPEHFYRRKIGTLSSYCKTCSRQISARNQKILYYSATAGFHLAYITRNTRQRAKCAGIVYDIDLAYVSALLKDQEGLCAISKARLTFEKGKGHIPTNASLDRIHPTSGYTRGNVQLVAWQVNVMKSNLSTSQLAEWCQIILQGLMLVGDDPRPGQELRAPGQ